MRAICLAVSSLLLFACSHKAPSTEARQPAVLGWDRLGEKFDAGRELTTEDIAGEVSYECSGLYDARIIAEEYRGTRALTANLILKRENQRSVTLRMTDGNSLSYKQGLMFSEAGLLSIEPMTVVNTQTPAGATTAAQPVVHDDVTTHVRISKESNKEIYVRSVTDGWLWDPKLFSLICSPR